MSRENDVFLTCMQPISWDKPDNVFRPRWLVLMHNRIDKIFFCGLSQEYKARRTLELSA